LVVLSILSALLGIGAIAYLRTAQRFKDEAAADRMEVVIRQARNNALSSGAPAFVTLETNRRTKEDEPLPPQVTPWGYRLVGVWHFEEAIGASATVPGAFGHPALARGCVTAEGKIGKAVALVALSKGQVVKGYVDCGADVDFDCEDGGYLEAYVFLEFGHGFIQYVFRKKNAYALALDARGNPTGVVGEKTLKATGYVVPPRRWTKMALAWDRRTMRLLVDDAVLAAGPGALTPLNDSPLLLGDSDLPVLGRIDEAKVLVALRGEPLELPRGAVLIHNAQPWDAVFFAPDGSLDMRYHPSPIQLDLELREKRRTVTVSMLGLTKRGEVERMKSKEEEQAERDAAEAAAFAAAPPKQIRRTLPLLPLPLRKLPPPAPPKSPTTETPAEPAPAPKENTAAPAGEAAAPKLVPPTEGPDTPKKEGPPAPAKTDAPAKDAPAPPAKGGGEMAPEGDRP
jgi:type II secretory pathway pseudopilin PulG